MPTNLLEMVDSIRAQVSNLVNAGDTSTAPAETTAATPPSDVPASGQAAAQTSEPAAQTSEPAVAPTVPPAAPPAGPPTPEAGTGTQDGSAQAAANPALSLSSLPPASGGAAPPAGSVGDPITPQSIRNMSQRDIINNRDRIFDFLRTTNQRPAA